MRFIDFFSGIGGFRLGMEMAGHECVGHCEIDKFANKSYIAMHKPKEGEWYADDIRRVSPEELPEAEVYCFGFPCQAFSIAGKRGGFKDTRGTLFFEVMRLAKVRKPEILFAENVKGLLNHDKGRTFGTIIRSMAELGYDVEWQIFDSQHFGVPQHRERVFIIGHLRGTCGRKIFPFGDNGKKTDELQRQVSGTITTRSGENTTVGTYVVENKQYAQKIRCININDDSGKERPQQDRIYSADGIMTALNSQLGSRHNIALGIYANASKEFTHPPLPNISRTLKANKHDAAVVLPVPSPERINKRQNGRRLKNNDEPMFTLTTQDRHGVAIYQKPRGYNKGGVHDIAPTLSSNSWNENNVLIDDCLIRKLTPKECFRLQGFPDEYFERAAAVNSDSQLYKQVGNSVTVNVIYEIARRLC